MPGIFSKVWGKIKAGAYVVAAGSLVVIGIIATGFDSDKGKYFVVLDEPKIVIDSVTGDTTYIDTLFFADSLEFVRVTDSLYEARTYAVYCYYMREDDGHLLGLKKGMLIQVTDPVDFPKHPSAQELKDFIVVKEPREKMAELIAFMKPNQPDSAITDTANYARRQFSLNFAKAGITVPARGVTFSTLDTGVVSKSNYDSLGVK